MTPVQAEALLYTYLSANWTATKIAWQNVEPRDFTSPSQPLLPEGTDDYIAVRVMLVNSTTITMPANCIRYRGQLMVGVCVKENTGTRTAKNRLSSLVELLENATISDVNGSLRIGNMAGSLGYPAPNGWYVEDSSFMFTFERFVAAP
jgi:hypothetical protein